MKSGFAGERALGRSRKQERADTPTVEAWKEHGTPGAERVAEDLKRFGTVTERTQQAIDAMPTRRGFQDRALEFFESEGIVRRERSGQFAFDPEALLKNPLGHAFRSKVGDKMRVFFERGVTQAIIDALGDVQAVTVRQTPNKAEAAKPILYVPKTVEDAFDLEKIRGTDFQMGLWETPLKLSDARIPGTDISQLEVAVAAAIYHPKYGNAHRDASGRLMVTDKEAGKTIPISGQWLRKMGLQRVAKDGARTFSPQEFLKTAGKHLVEFGILKPEDFLQQSAGNIKESGVAERYRVNKTGEVMMNGVLYYLGRHFVGKQLRVFELAPGKGGIALIDEQGGERLAFTFRMFDREDPNLKRVKFGSGKLIPRAGAADVELAEVHEDLKEPASTAPRRGAASVKQAAEELWTKARIKLSDIPESAQRDAPQLIELAGKLGPLLMRDVFLAYLGIVKETDRVERAIESTAGGETARSIDRERMRGDLLVRARTLLAEAANESQKPQATASALLRKLEGYRIDLVLLASVFKAAFKGKEGRAAFDEMKGVTLESRTAEDLTSEDRMGMRAISFMNWKEVPSMAEYIQKSLEEKLTHGGVSNRFYMLKKDGDAVAFMRFEDRPDGSRYAGSLNVAPSMRGSGLGEAFFKKSLDVEGRDHRLIANIHPKTLAGTAYVERNGFTITGAEPVPMGDQKKTEWGFVIEREPKNDEAPESGQRMTTEYIMSLARSGEIGPGGAVAKRYDVRHDAARMKEDTIELTRRGLMGTRYFPDPHDAETRYILFTPSRKAGAEKRARSGRS